MMTVFIALPACTHLNLAYVVAAALLLLLFQVWLGLYDECNASVRNALQHAMLGDPPSNCLCPCCCAAAAAAALLGVAGRV
jgi:hypothetical protein